MPPPKQPRRLRFETLESRRLLAGNVVASIQAGTLVLQGDDVTNGVSVFRGAAPGEVVVAGRGWQPAEYTAVNGSFTPVTLSGFTRGVRVDLGGGYNFVTITNITIVGDVVGVGSSGDDYLTITSNLESVYWSAPLNSGAWTTTGDAAVFGNVLFSGEDGNDRLDLVDAPVIGDVTFDGGPGFFDYFVANGRYVGPTAGDDIGGNLTVTLSNGRDEAVLNNMSVGRNALIQDLRPAVSTDVYVQSSRVRGDLRINTASGADYVNIAGNIDQDYVLPMDPTPNVLGNVFVSTGAGADKVYIYDGTAASISIDTAGGDEGNGFFGVIVARMTLTGDAIINTGDGFDNVLFDTSTAQRLRIFTGDGSDGIIVLHSTFGDSMISSGNDYDILGVHYSSFSILRSFFATGHDNLLLFSSSVSSLLWLDGADTNYVILMSTWQLPNQRIIGGTVIMWFV